MTHRIQYNPHLHVSLLYVVLLEAAFSDNSDEPLLKVPVAEMDAGVLQGAMFEPSPAETALMRALVGDSEPAAHPIFLLNPNASDLLPLRKWENAKFVELGRRLLAEFPSSRLVVTGAPSERAGADQLCRAIDSTRAVSAAGRTSLRELLTLYTLASVLVTNDSGPAHFASLTPVHTVVLFGPETPRLFGSRSPETTIIWKQLACSPCVSVFNHRLSPCRNNLCMQLITVDEVFDAVCAAMGAV
jgi:ADP-heptose:LPS heptosyltransferase